MNKIIYLYDTYNEDTEETFYFFLDSVCRGLWCESGEHASYKFCPCCGRKLEKFNKLEYEKTQEVYMKLDANSFKSALKRAKENVEKRG